MSPEKKEDWPLIRKDLVDKVEGVIDRVGGIEIQQALCNEQMKSILARLDGHGEQQRKMYGDFNDFITRFNIMWFGTDGKPGFAERQRNLEEEQTKRNKRSEYVLKGVLGAVTIGLGSAMLWLWKIIIEALKH